MKQEEKTQVFQGVTSEDVRLERLGYEQGTLDIISFISRYIILTLCRAQTLLRPAGHDRFQFQRGNLVSMPVYQ